MMLYNSYQYLFILIGGDRHGNYSTIQEAIENASDGNLYVRDTVYLFNDSSSNHENVVVDKTIRFQGENI
jgi:hypothetical protein